MKRLVVSVVTAVFSVTHAMAQSQFDGRWTLTLKCSKLPDTKAYKHIFNVNVKDGVLDGDYIVPGHDNGHFHLYGPIRSDGSAYLHMSGESGNPEYTFGHPNPGAPIDFDLDSKFTSSQGKGRRVQQRPCVATFSKMP